MRDILFRGKRIYEDEWVEGSLICFADGCCFVCVQGENMDFMDKFGVIPETVGQYTGLTDKNGKKVFEGDIVKCTDKTYDYSFNAVVIFGNPNGEYNWGFQLKRISGASANTDILLWFDMDDVGAFAEVVGNIHDNEVK